MKKTVLTLILMMFAGATQAYCYGNNNCNIMNLTADQQANIQKIHEKYRPTNIETRQKQQQNHHKQMLQLISNKTFSETDARKLIAAQEQDRVEFKLQRLKERHEIYQILDAEQQKKWLMRDNMSRCGNFNTKGFNNKQRRPYCN